MWTVSLTQYYTATTLDGFIADADHSLDWLFTRNRDPDGPLSYGAFIADVGAMAMGSTTYEWILDHEFAGKDPQAWKGPYAIPCGCASASSPDRVAPRRARAKWRFCLRQILRRALRLRQRGGGRADALGRASHLRRLGSVDSVA